MKKYFVIEEIDGIDSNFSANHIYISDLSTYKPKDEWIFYIEIEIKLMYLGHPDWGRERIYITFASPKGYSKQNENFNDIDISFVCFLNRYNGKLFLNYIQEIIEREQKDSDSSTETIIKLSRYFRVETLDDSTINIDYFLKKIKSID